MRKKKKRGPKRGLGRKVVRETFFFFFLGNFNLAILHY